MEELNLSDSKLSSDRILGRIEMGTRLLTDLKNFVAEKDKLQEPVKRNRKGKMSPLAGEPEIPSEVKIGGQV